MYISFWIMVPTLGGYLHGENLFVSPRFHACIVFAFFHMLLSVSYGPDAVDIGFVSSAGQSWEMRIEKPWSSTLPNAWTVRVLNNLIYLQKYGRPLEKTTVKTRYWKRKEQQEMVWNFCTPFAGPSISWRHDLCSLQRSYQLLLGFCRNWWQKPTKT